YNYTHIAVSTASSADLFGLLLILIIKIHSQKFLQDVKMYSNYSAVVFLLLFFFAFLPSCQDLGVEISLTDQFCQQHFLIGVLWALLKSTSQCYRQPIIILRNLLIKHCLDPRYHSSKAIQARICSLYLPLVRLMLDYYDSLGPPGLASEHIPKWLQKEIEFSTH
ncbi:unnamed protein product, partial [Trichobilharzia regenti]